MNSLTVTDGIVIAAMCAGAAFIGGKYASTTTTVIKREVIIERVATPFLNACTAQDGPGTVTVRAGHAAQSTTEARAAKKWEAYTRSENRRAATEDAASTRRERAEAAERKAAGDRRAARTW